jgi:predicted RNA-binding Zn-ribbon protein involved in translation (DUF1610 family)
MGESLIDIVLAIIIGAICLIAARLIPSKEKIQRNETAKYKSSKNFIYIAGVSSLSLGILFILLYIIEKDYQRLVNILKMVVFLVMGIALISENFKKSKMLVAQESAITPVTAEIMPTGVTAQGIPGTQPFAQQAQLQQVAVKPIPAAPAQPQVQAQQVGLKAMPTPQVQPQPVAQQPRPTIAPAPKSKIVVIKCPKCQGSMQINTAMLGQKMKCPHCGVEGRIG